MGLLSDQNILTTVVFLPLAGAIILMFFNKESKGLIRVFANLVGLAGFLVSLPLWFRFDRAISGEMQFVREVPWIPSIGVQYSVGVDGISLP